jgi:hypothetical protein
VLIIYKALLRSVPTYSSATAYFSFLPHNFNVKFSAQTQPSRSYHNFVVTHVFDCKTQKSNFSPDSQLISCATHYNNPLPITWLSPHPNALPCFQSTLNRRTIGHFLEILKSPKNIFLTVTYCMSLATPLLRFFLFSFLPFSSSSSSLRPPPPALYQDHLDAEF